MDERQQRGLMIAATARIKQRREGTFEVPSQSLTGKYTVCIDEKGKDCSCPDYELRQQPCKHVFAVEFFLQRERVTTPEGITTETETRSVRVTYAQNWPAYNRAQMEEKETFCRLLRDLCATVPEPEQTRGRPRLPLNDALFAAAFKVYSTVSGRRFMTDMRDAQAKGLVAKAPHYNSIFKVIESDDVTPILIDLITASALPLRAVESTFAIDSTGFSANRFYRHYTAKYGGREQYARDYVKLHAVCGVKTNVIVAASVTDRDRHDYPEFQPLIERTTDHFNVTAVCVDKAYNGHTNLEQLDAQGIAAYIPFRSNARPGEPGSLWNRLFHYFSFNREEFLPLYHARSNIETTFSAVKRKFGDFVRSKTPTAQVNECLLKVLCHNLVCLIHEMHNLGVDPLFPAIGADLRPQVSA